MDALFDRAAEDARALPEIARELERHAQLEEEIFYPAVASASDEGASAVREARRHHADLRARAAGADARAVEALRSQVARHVEFEERIIFAEAQRSLSKEALVELAERMEQRNRELGGTLPLARPRRGKPLEKVIRPKRVRIKTKY
jgi:iron-sulfur cluster repair protein YtfE (RIC family)